MMGIYLNYTFEDCNVRFIAVTDGVDTLKNPDDLVMPIKNVVNAQYARECGRKTKAARISLAKDGKYIGSRPPYGYMKDPADRHHLIPDPETAPVVKRIYSMYCSGEGIKRIASMLRGEKILTPQAYSGFSSSKDAGWRREYDWHVTTVKAILTNEEYTGCIINCKEQVRGSVKKKREITPEESRIVIRGTHEAIITEEQFELAQSVMKNRYRPDRTGERQKDRRAADILRTCPVLDLRLCDEPFHQSRKEEILCLHRIPQLRKGQMHVTPYKLQCSLPHSP